MRKYLEDRMGCLRAYVEDVRAKHIKDIDLASASGFLSQVKATGVSARTVNRYYQAMKQFGLWLVRTRRVQFDPFDGLKKLNEEADRRHVRRALTPEEAQRLIEAARTRPLSWTHRGKKVEPKTLATRRKLQALGEMRALIYLIALGTGLRRSEIRRLRWCDVDHERALVRIPAKSAKSRRDQTVPLPGRLAEALREARPADAAGTDTVVPEKAFPNSVTFRRDVEAAGIEREDAEGRVVDLHALRHSFVTWIAMGGAHPKVAQALARHASVQTTLDRYTDLALINTKGTVEGLPLPKRRPGRPIGRTAAWDRRGAHRARQAGR